MIITKNQITCQIKTNINTFKNNITSQLNDDLQEDYTSIEIKYQMEKEKTKKLNGILDVQKNEIMLLKNQYNDIIKNISVINNKIFNNNIIEENKTNQICELNFMLKKKMN